ncbi:pyocin activator PrtN family protein [Paraburkholderia sp. SIMBA_054]|uniref:pyocin activator PrtN family protein n=1 Tax=Paraburkholderia sp. SIMBA_054 TaxID=3085795 RepID=UPI00397B0754
MKTVFFLMAQYDARVVIPIEEVCRDYFPTLQVDKLLRKCAAGEIPLPIMRMEKSQKAMRGVHLVDLAIYLDEQLQAGKNEWEQFKAGRLP